MKASRRSSPNPRGSEPCVYIIQIEESVPSLISDGCLQAHWLVKNPVPANEIQSPENCKIFKIGATTSLKRRLFNFSRWPYIHSVAGLIQTELLWLLESYIHSQFISSRIELLPRPKVVDGIRHYGFSLGGEFFVLNEEQTEKLLNADWLGLARKWEKTITREEILICMYPDFHSRLLHPRCSDTSLFAKDSEAKYNCFWHRDVRNSRCDKCIERIHSNKELFDYYSNLNYEEYQDYRSEVVSYYSALCTHDSSEVRKELVWLVKQLVHYMNREEFESIAELARDSDLDTRCKFLREMSFLCSKHPHIVPVFEEAVKDYDDSIFIRGAMGLLRAKIMLNDNIKTRLCSVIEKADANELCDLFPALRASYSVISEEVVLSCVMALNRSEIRSAAFYSYMLICTFFEIVAKAGPLSQNTKIEIRGLDQHIEDKIRDRWNEFIKSVS